MIWFFPHHISLSPVSKLDRRHTRRERRGGAKHLQIINAQMPRFSPSNVVRGGWSCLIFWRAASRSVWREERAPPSTSSCPRNRYICSPALLLPVKRRNYVTHKVLTYTKHHSVCPFVGIGTPPTLVAQATVPSPPPKGGSGTLACVCGGVGAPIPTTGTGEKA
jgi:hypothetical protein